MEGLLKGVETKTSVDFFDHRAELQSIAKNTVFTGCVDEYYGFQYGHLEYRSVRFEEQLLDTPNYQGCAVVNYTGLDVPYTRIIEHKHFEQFGDTVYKTNGTIISREYSSEWRQGGIPFYPVNDEKNMRVYAKYEGLANNEKNVIFIGRLAEYKYYDMAPLIEAVMQLFEHNRSLLP